MGVERITLSVRGMTCAHCVAAVKRSLEAVPGVREAAVTLEPPRAAVTYDPSKATVEAMTKATEEEGYPSSPAAGG
ncbi:MAG: heavy-metal-associated domain-containing protein [Verrucomicrobiota bacterium]